MPQSFVPLRCTTSNYSGKFHERFSKRKGGRSIVLFFESSKYRFGQVPISTRVHHWYIELFWPYRNEVSDATEYKLVD